ncbi:putative dsRNA-binding protein, partial [Desulfofundulus sp.]|uniref:putative dsRNA-binding protein n=1 Tax=Desulfofundulus sp. TaxID=2282750 RepID=UPI003C772A9C
QPDIELNRCQKQHQKTCRELQELVQEEGRVDISYAILREEGPDHHKTFTAAVYLAGKEMGRGQGHSKKEAEQQAACRALASLGYLSRE